jgi:hypothetical protein
MKMTPEQKIKALILAVIARWEGADLPTITAENVDDLYDGADDDQLQDARNEVREGELATDVPAPYSRHYEARSVAAKAPDGSWVGWTYWYGGGKHGEPEAIDWMDEAYDLTCVEEEKLVTVRTFTITESEAAA